MTDHSFDRIADAYLAPGPTVLPDRVFDAAFEEVHRTRRRRVLRGLPWRDTTLNSYAKIAIAAVAVVAIGYIGLNLMGSGSTGVGASPSPSSNPSPTASPTVAPPSPTPGPSTPALTGQFTSDRHGFSISYPVTWSTRAATAPWTGGFIDFTNPSADVIYEPSNAGNLWLAAASQALGSRTPAQFEADVWQALVADDPATAGCAAEATPITIDGVDGVIACQVAVVTSDGRGYYITAYASDDDPSLPVQYDQAWFESVLATLKLDPAAAVDSAS